MIGYRISRDALEKLISAHDPKWLADTKKRTATFKKNKKYEEKSAVWSRVKVVYMRLQGDCKCAYCERKLEAETYGKVEQDVEHFRPKASVRDWSLPQDLAAKGIQVAKAPKAKKGYYLLPYHPFNYAAACKPCNSALKSDCFPIAGKHKFSEADPAKLKTEKALLIYPIGDIDESPEKLIQFYAVSPQAVATKGFARDRALVSIEFFKLDSVEERSNLILERARVIMALFPQLQQKAGGDTVSAQLVDAFTNEKSPHTNCARSFRDLYAANPAEAKAAYEAATALILSKS